MAHLKEMNGFELMHFLERNGFVKTRERGSHTIMKGNGKTVIVPLHHHDLGKGLLKQILKEANLLEAFKTS